MKGPKPKYIYNNIQHFIMVRTYILTARSDRENGAIRKTGYGLASAAPENIPEDVRDHLTRRIQPCTIIPSQYTKNGSSSHEQSPAEDHQDDRFHESLFLCV